MTGGPKAAQNKGAQKGVVDNSAIAGFPPKAFVERTVDVKDERSEGSASSFGMCHRHIMDQRQPHVKAAPEVDIGFVKESQAVLQSDTRRNVTSTALWRGRKNSTLKNIAPFHLHFGGIV